LLFAAGLIFPNLGRDALWNDEGDTAYRGLSVCQSGRPLAWDGTHFNAEDAHAVTEDLTLATLPWLPFYATAASMTLFGETTWAVRLPFALAGWVTILMVYLLTWHTVKNKNTALCSAGLLLLSVQFLLYARSCRYYAFVMLFTCLALWFFLKLDNRRKIPVFSLTIILLFHSLYLPAICVLAALAALTVVYTPFHKYRRGFWLSLLITVPATLPWLLWVLPRLGADTEGTLSSLSELGPRVAQSMIEVSIAAPLLGWIGLLFLVKKPFLKNGGDLLVLCGTVTATFVCADICIHNPDQMANMGLRHSSGIIPLAAIISSVLVFSAGHTVWKRNVILLLLLGTTHLGGNFFPWLILKSEHSTNKKASKTKLIHAPDRWWKMVFRCEIPGYFLELCTDNPGTTTAICQTLLKHANPDDILFANYAWEPLYFYTRMPQAGKLGDPSHPAYEIARRHDLPNYVFDASAADWVVWRPGWSFYRNGEEQLYQALVAWKGQGKTWTEIARIKDTLWENRPNVYYHRFPVFGYIYPGTWPTSFPEAVILRVE
jgi:hypothetical protein